MPPSRYVRLTDQPQVIIFEPLPPTLNEGGQYGPKVEYAVNGNQILSASQYLASQIDATRDPDNRTAMSIRMYKANGRTRYDIENVAQGGYQQARQAPRQAPRESVNAQRSYNASPAPQAAPQRTFQDIEDDMAYCLSVGLSLAGNHLGSNFTSEDARAIATSLFIEANRAGIRIPRFTEGDIQVERDTPPYTDEDYPEEFPEEPPFEVPPRRR